MVAAAESSAAAESTEAVDGAADEAVAAESIAATERLEPRKALVRKVAQLTKVVVHLNARNDEAESRYERLRFGFEDELQNIAEDAALKLAAERAKLQALIDPAALATEATQVADVWTPKRAAGHAQLEAARLDAVAWHAQLAEKAQERLQADARDLQEVASAIRKAMEAFHVVVGRSRADLEQKDAALQEQRAAELRAARVEHQRRVEDLRAAQARDAEHMAAAAQQARAHMQRMHDSEMSTLRMQALQRRREKIHRSEQGFGEERRSLEQQTQHMAYEAEQQRHEVTDAVASRATIQKQVDGMRAALDELIRRVEQSEADVAQARAEATEKEAIFADFQSEVAVLQVRQRIAGVVDTPAPAFAEAAPVAQATAQPPERRAANELSNELRGAILSSKQMEAEVDRLDAALNNVDEDLTERDKQVEVLEVELEEEQLRTHQLQARVKKWEALMECT